MAKSTAMQSTVLQDDDIDTAEEFPKPEVPNAGPISTKSLDALQSANQREVMDIVDNLRHTGLNSIVELPQLVVCGDQSSGKSSVLEAITEIPFPRKENLCTRYATEVLVRIKHGLLHTDKSKIILRRSLVSTISITIAPDKLRSTQEQDTLRSFSRSINDFSQLPNIMEEATQEMGLGSVGGQNYRAFSRDVLSVEITGPDRPQLTVVDLPGLIHATNKAQSEADKELILDLVKEYMNNTRTIILAVVSAKNDFANQVILEHCRKVDEHGRRTLGIITKPDYLKEGSQNELTWIELAQNKDIYFDLGWHMLKNRDDNEAHFTFEQRNLAEKIFFSKGRYVEMPRECVGIDSLRKRLSNVLLRHLIQELPSLKKEIILALDATLADIAKLGEKCGTVKEQQMMLMKMSMYMNDIIKSAMKGFYEMPFFGAIDMKAPVDALDNVRRFRAVIQHLNLAFAKNMRLMGHKYSFGAGPGDDEKDIKEQEKAQEELVHIRDKTDLDLDSYPQHLTRDEAVRWVKTTLERSRGYELPGIFQPMLISQLFWEQSQPWEQIALAHINKVARLCKEFVYAVAEETTSKEFVGRLIAFNIDEALAKSLKDAREELQKILKDKARHPSTCNHYFTTTLQKTRQNKYRKLTHQAAKASEESVYVSNSGYKTTKVNIDRLEEAMSNAVEQNMDVFSSQEALDAQRAYYKNELKYFVDAVVKAVIERHLVDPLPDSIFSPLTVARMTDQEIQSIATESTEVRQRRSRLEKKKEMLEKGLEAFRKAASDLKD